MGPDPRTRLRRFTDAELDALEAAARREPPAPGQVGLLRKLSLVDLILEERLRRKRQRIRETASDD